MRRVRVTQRADGDLESILRRGLKEHAPAVAIAYYDKILRAFAKIASSPLVAQEHPEHGAGIRFHFHGSHRIVYRLDGEEIIIVRVLHGRQETHRHL